MLSVNDSVKVTNSMATTRTDKFAFACADFYPNAAAFSIAYVFALARADARSNATSCAGTHDFTFACADFYPNAAAFSIADVFALSHADARSNDASFSIPDSAGTHVFTLARTVACSNTASKPDTFTNPYSEL
jgi:predicted outer membrane lipoprotein